MRQLPLPPYDPLSVLNKCVEGISNSTLSNKHINSRPSVEQAYTAYDAAHADTSWCLLPRVPRGNEHVLIAGNLSKADLNDLYSSHMVKSKGDARRIYDDIKLAAENFCPFCGGLGIVYTLDHFLPKANFPAYSVHPTNLVPCCRDCNSNKNASFGLVRGEQTLHPYLDDPKFFSQRWVRASISRTNPIVVNFISSPPLDWSADDRQRVGHHFDGYDLAHRFSVQASAEVARIVRSRQKSLRPLSEDDYRELLRESADIDEIDLNGWSRTMYQALVDSTWFANVDFCNPEWHME